MVCYTFQYDYDYKVIIGCNIILQEYYITDKRKYENTRRYIIMKSTKGTHELQKKNLRDEKGSGRIGPRMVNCYSTMLPLHHSDHQKVHHSSNSRIWTCISRVIRSNPTRGKMSAKWHVRISTRVSINLNHKYALKIMS